MSGTEHKPLIRVDGPYSTACGEQSTFVAVLTHRRVDAQRQARHAGQHLAIDRLTHAVRFTAGSDLREIYGPGAHRVTSIHHPCVDRLGTGLAVEAVCPDDGVIEAIRLKGAGFGLGVQWHPEFHLTQRDQALGLLDSGPMMQSFLAAARHRAQRLRGRARATPTPAAPQP